MATLPIKMADVLLHDKDNDRTEVAIFPITRYGNNLNAPNVVSDPENSPGAPFHLLKKDTVDVPIEKIRDMCGNIV